MNKSKIFYKCGCPSCIRRHVKTYSSMSTDYEYEIISFCKDSMFGPIGEYDLYLKELWE